MIQRTFFALTLQIFCLGLAPLMAQQNRAGEPPTEKVPYKTVNGQTLELWIWKPEGWKATDKRGAMVFYHGGGWRKGSPTAFSRQSAALAKQGMVAISAQYRLTQSPGVEISDCVKDARSAFRYVRANADRLGIDPNRIAAGGGSAGGHLAACLIAVDVNDEKDDLSISTLPSALALFNPVVDLDLPRIRAIADPKGMEEALKISPYHHLKARHPPVIIFHGDEDTTVPILSAKRYVNQLKELGCDAELVSFKGQQHSFFNKEPFMSDTLKQTADFLVKHGLLSK